MRITFDYVKDRKFWIWTRIESLGAIIVSWYRQYDIVYNSKREERFLIIVTVGRRRRTQAIRSLQWQAKKPSQAAGERANGRSEWTSEPTTSLAVRKSRPVLWLSEFRRNRTVVRPRRRDYSTNCPTATLRPCCSPLPLACRTFLFLVPPKILPSCSFFLHAAQRKILHGSTRAH